MGKELVLERLIEDHFTLGKVNPDHRVQISCQEQFSTHPVEVVMLGEGIECICRLDLAVVSHDVKPLVLKPKRHITLAAGNIGWNQGYTDADHIVALATVDLGGDRILLTTEGLGSLRF
jgi:hypothetical protein